MEETFNSNKSSDLRGRNAYRVVNDFELARRVGGGKMYDLRSEPTSETDRALIRSRELLAKLRVMVTNP